MPVAKLPPAAVDLILLVDVYHEFSHPFEMTEAMVKALKPGGQLVFVEYCLEDPEVPIKIVHKMSVTQVIREMRPTRSVTRSRVWSWKASTTPSAVACASVSRYL